MIRYIIKTQNNINIHKKISFYTNKMINIIYIYYYNNKKFYNFVNF